MSRPRIGITGSIRRTPFKRWIDALAVWLAGGHPVSMRADWPADVEALDGLVVTGGISIDPAVYRGETRPDPDRGHGRDQFELALLDHAIEHRKPVLGICRGAQLINVHAGGTLHEDVRQAYPEVPVIRTLAPVREVFLRPGSLLARVVGDDPLHVNALHEQAVDQVGEGASICAKDANGIVQALEHDNAHFVLGVQWHPEWLVWQRRQLAIYCAFIEAARNRLSAASPVA